MSLLSVALTLALIHSVSTILPLRITIINVHDPIIMFRMLVHIFGSYTIPRRISIAGQLYIFFENLVSVSANTDTRTVAIKALASWGPITAPPAAAARPLRILPLSHVTVTLFLSAWSNYTYKGSVPVTNGF